MLTPGARDVPASCTAQTRPGPSEDLFGVVKVAVAACQRECPLSEWVMRLDGSSLGVADGTGLPIRSGWRYWSLECSRCWLYQLIQRKIARLAPALVTNRWRWTSSRFRLDQNASATALRFEVVEPHTWSPPWDRG